MTRFQIVAIFNDKILTAGEFNGDGYFENGHGEEICEAFENMKTKEDYLSLVNWINDKHFNYNEKLIYELEDGVEDDYFNFYRPDDNYWYYEQWFSDYLYIINLSEEEKEIIDDSGTRIIIKPNGWLTLNFGKLYDQEDYEIKARCQNNIEIKTNERIIEICEENGWSVYEDEDYISIGIYTPAGEDFSFDVDKTNNIMEEISRYAESFDVDEHVTMWINSNCNGVPSIRTLLEDAEWIDEELQKLVNEIKKI